MWHVWRERRNAYRILVGKPESKRQIGGPRCRREENDKMDLKERRWQIVDWINMVQDKQKWWAVVIAVTNFGINKIWGTS
jgi:hypothetical protein